MIMGITMMVNIMVVVRNYTVMQICSKATDALTQVQYCKSDGMEKY